ncbi:MAG: peptidoglycan editing factor PgeF [Acidobacteria bacterium]|nr:peptidoglycan editing factor PgeF [Acidobacteriota bacterium]
MSLARELKVEPSRLLRVRQVHGTAAIVVPNGDLHLWRDDSRPEADAIITADPSTALAVQVADCTPILLADRNRRAVAAIHAGWRGSAAGIVSSVVERLRSELGMRPDDVIAAVGPGIGPCCYEVGDEVREAFRAKFGQASGSWFVAGTATPRAARRLDLWTATRDQLVASGVPASQIHVAALCTATHLDLFHSFRKERDQTGRMAAVIRLA